MTTPPTRRSLREAQRRSESGSIPVTGTRPGPHSPAAHHVPSWAHHGPAAPPRSTPGTEAIARSAPAQQSRSAWSAGPQTRAAAPATPAQVRAAAPVTPAASAAAPAAPPQTRAAAPAAPSPHWSATPAPFSAAPTPTPLPTLPAQVQAPVAPTVPTVVRAVAPTAAIRIDAPEPVAPEPVVLTPAAPAGGVEDVPELEVTAHGTVPRRSRKSTRVAARLSVLGVLAGITVVIPVSQGLVPSPVAFGSDALADSTLPTTVSALAGAPLSALPPTSLMPTDGALQARDLATASRTEERSALPGCDGSMRPAGQNGLLKTADLCNLWDNHTKLRADAAVSLAELNQAFAARFGGDLCISGGYRTLAEQRSVKAQKGGLAAVPGKSNHGWGLAVDLCQDQTSGAKWRWITENAPTYGWENPAWAQPGGSGPYERWHWEFTKGVQADGEYYDG
ncbi:D-alanyl-D-alanine carboxypeptidase family protein [Cellulomonas sp. Leaf395]|uniref:D-alanyl-D-alanine carboxypeptidase family protein n=1 Tax=Cellulomonas sp. Leaf395 TaxID=1736362 RepID=UPI0012FBADB9|nr:D-alanyl-D-alanine carboxypeptidase family protein [Cellulomonas sp. Leaf395]